MKSIGYYQTVDGDVKLFIEEYSVWYSGDSSYINPYAGYYVNPYMKKYYTIFRVFDNANIKKILIPDGVTRISLLNNPIEKLCGKLDFISLELNIETTIDPHDYPDITNISLY